MYNYLKGEYFFLSDFASFYNAKSMSVYLDWQKVDFVAKDKNYHNYS